MTQRKVVPKEIKNEILAKVKGGEKVADLARQYGISDKSIYTHPITHKSAIASIGRSAGFDPHGKGTDSLQAFPERFGAGRAVALATQKATKTGD